MEVGVDKELVLLRFLSTNSIQRMHEEDLPLCRRKPFP